MSPLASLPLVAVLCDADGDRDVVVVAIVTCWAEIAPHLAPAQPGASPR